MSKIGSVRRFDENSFIVSCSSTSKISTMQGYAGSKKVRMQNSTIISRNTVDKVVAVFGDSIDYLDDSAEVAKAISDSRDLRCRNVAKIKSLYGKGMPFDYDYKGVYPSIMEHQKAMYNMMRYTNGVS